MGLLGEGRVTEDGLMERGILLDRRLDKNRAQQRGGYLRWGLLQEGGLIDRGT